MLWPKVSLRRLALLLFLCVAALLALPSLAAGAFLWWSADRTWDYRERWAGIWLLAIPGCLTYALLLRYVYPIKLLLAVSSGGVWQRLCLLWAVHMLLTPGISLLLEAFNPWRGRTRHSSARARPAVKVAGVRALPPVSMREVEGEALGSYLGGDLDEWVRAQQVCLPLAALWRHGVVIGEPGYGKTLTLLRLATIAVRNEMQVIFLDLKGSQKTAAQFVAAMRHAGVRRIKVFPGEAYDGWRGDATALYNRLMAMVDPGTHPYYYRLTSALVALVVHAPAGPPRNSRDFLLRLEIGTRKQPGWLMRAYADPRYWYEMRKVEKLRPHISNLSLAYDGFFAGVADALDGNFAFEDADAVFIGLDGDVLKEQAAGMGRYLLQDAAHYAKQRKPLERHALMIIDEFGVLKTSNATDLYERMREAGMSIWSSAQNYQALGAERANILASASVKILHRCGSPEELVKFAGQRESVAFSQITDDSDEVNESPLAAGQARLFKRRTAVRMQRQNAVSLEDVQQLAIGRVVVISGGLYTWVQVYPPAQGEEPRHLLPGASPDPPPRQTEAQRSFGSVQQEVYSMAEVARLAVPPAIEWDEDGGPVDFFS